MPWPKTDASGSAPPVVPVAVPLEGAAARVLFRFTRKCIEAFAVLMPVKRTICASVLA